MPKKRFNFKLALVLIIAASVFAVTLYSLRQYRKSKMIYNALEKGNLAYQQSLWHEAAKNLGRYLAVIPNDIQILTRYADAQLKIRPPRQANIQQAIAAYRTILRNRKNDFNAAKNIINLYLRLNLPGEAELVAETFIQKYPNPEIQTLMAAAMIKQRKFTQAIDQLLSVTAQHPSHILAYETLARLCRKRPKYFTKEPLYYYNQAIKHNPSSALAYTMRGSFHLRQNDIKKALIDFDLAQKQDCSDIYANLRLAEELIRINDCQNAHRRLAIVKSQEPDNQTCWNLLATLALKSGSKEKMRQVAQDALSSLSRQPWDFMPIAAELFILAGDYEQAGHCIRKLRDKDIAPEKTALLQGLLADCNQRYHEAIKHWRQAMELGNDSPKLYFLLADALIKQSDYLSAIQLLRGLISKNPDLAAAHMKLAQILSQTGNWSETAEHTETAVRIGPYNLQAVLLNIQARIQLLIKNQTDPDSQQWAQLEKLMVELEKNDKITADVKLLRFQLALRHDQLDHARQLLKELETDNLPALQLAIARAQLLTAEKNFNAAATALRQTIIQFPQSAQPVLLLATLLDSRKRTGEYEDIMTQAITRLNQPEDKRRLGLLLSAKYNQHAQQDKSYKLLKSLAGEMPDDIPLKRQLLNYQTQIATPNYCRQIIEQIKALEGQAGWQWKYEQAKLRLRSRDFIDHYPQIISLLRENLAAIPDNMQCLILLAAAYEKADRLQLAVKTYQDALRRRPYNIDLIVSTVSAMHKAKLYRQARQILDDAAKVNLSDRRLLKLSAQNHLANAKIEPAIEVIKVLAENDPNDRNMIVLLALLNMHQKRFDQAETLLDKLSIQEPNSLQVAAAKARLDICRANIEQALNFYDTLVADSNDAQAYIERANANYMLGRLSQAEQDFSRAVDIEPQNPQAWIAKTQFYNSISRPYTARENIEKALSMMPDNLNIQKCAIRLLLNTEDIKTLMHTEKIIEKALAKKPDDIELLIYKARFLLKRQTAPAIRQAQGILKKITQTHPQAARAWAILAQSAVNQANIGQAMDLVLQALAYSPNNRDLLLLKANIESLHSPQLAVLTLEHLSSLEPHNVDTAIKLAQLLAANGNCQRAINLLENHLAYRKAPGPDTKKLTIALTMALYKAGRKTDAENHLDRLSQSAPDDPAVLLARLDLLKSEKRYKQLTENVAAWYKNNSDDYQTPLTIAKTLAAEQNPQTKQAARIIFEMILDKDPDCTDAITAFAMLLQLLGQHQHAAELYQRVVELEPDNVLAINNLAWILCENHHEYQKALLLAEKGLQMAPQYPDLLDTHAVACYRLGRFDDAEAGLAGCIRLYPANTAGAVSAHFHLGRTLAKLGHNNQAIKNLEQSLNLNNKIAALSGTDLAQAKILIRQLMEDINNVRLTNR